MSRKARSWTALLLLASASTVPEAAEVSVSTAPAVETSTPPAAVAVSTAAAAPRTGVRLGAAELVDRANKALRGESSHCRITMTVVTPEWTRELDIEAWNQGRERALIVIHAPAKDKGNTTLRRRGEMWVWMPRVDRVMKVPPTMMHSSWQGSDFTYEDIVKADSIVRDYDHSILERRPDPEGELVKVLALPKPDAPVVWGKINLWCRVYPDGGVVGVLEEDYNERGELVRSIRLGEVKTIQGRRVPTLLECRPERRKGQKTTVRYRELEFDVGLQDRFFSLGRLQRSAR